MHRPFEPASIMKSTQRFWLVEVELAGFGEGRRHDREDAAVAGSAGHEGMPS